MQSKNLTVIIPVHNEEQTNVDYLISQLEWRKINYLIIDDGSTMPVNGDSSGWYSTTRGGPKKLVNPYGTIIRLSKNKGYGAAIKYGLRNCNSKYVGIIDADNQYDVMDLVDMWSSLQGEDMVTGRRISHQGGFKRFFGRLFIKLVASCATGKYIKDLRLRS